MVTIEVGRETVELENFREGWLVEQLRRRSSGGDAVCVRVYIREGDIRLALGTPECPTGRGVPRELNPREQAIIDLWQARGLNDADWSVGNLIAFLKQLPRHTG